MTSSQHKKPEKKTSSGLSIKETYQKSDVLNCDDRPEAGVFPFVRGVQKSMYRGRLWTMRQYAGFGSAFESNQRYKKLIAEGGSGLSVAFDLPTQMGLDSDDPMARGEVGKTGVAIDSLDDMRALFDDIPLGQVSTSMTINAPASILLAMYLVVAKERGIPWTELRGTIQNDILKEYIARGTYIFPVVPSLRLITDIFSFCHINVPLFNTISISGYHIREAGATAVQEVAFTLANGLEYVKSAIASGLDVNDFAPRLSFFFNAHNNFFEEIAKFRGARLLWAELMRERFGANDRACQLRFHTQTAGSTLTAQDPDNNIVRVAYQAMSAVLGGTQSLHTNSKDEALGLPTPESATLALRTQQILACETGVADTVDPLAGSYFVESLTNELVARARALISEIDNYGGSALAIEQGFMQRHIQESAFVYQKSLEAQEVEVIGVNKYLSEGKTSVPIFKVSEEAENEQIKRLTKYRQKVDDKGVKHALTELERGAKSDENLMPLIIQAVTQGATLGQITQALKNQFGRYRDKNI